MPDNKQKQLKTTLLKFYKQPVGKVSTELFLSIFTIIFFAVFAIKPTLTTMSDLVKEIEDKQKLNKQMQQKVTALATAQTEYEKFQDQFYLLDQSLPTVDPQIM